MTILNGTWEREVRQSRVVISPSDNSYVREVGVEVWMVIHHLANGLSEDALLKAYPLLTKADIRACTLFVYLRAIKKI